MSSHNGKTKHANQVTQANWDFLSNMAGDEDVGVDKEGRLYKVVKSSSTAQSIYSSAKDKEIAQQIAADYTVDKLKELEFRHQKTGRDAYLNLVDKFAKAHLLSEEQRTSIAFRWYNQRYTDLVESGIRENVSEAIIVMEILNDPNIDDKYKASILPEPTKGGRSDSYFIKNREGKIIGVFKPQYQEVHMPYNSKGDARDYNPKAPLKSQRKGHVQGTSWIKEAAGYEIASDGYIGIPQTTKVSLLFPKIWEHDEIVLQDGSFQDYVADARTIHELTDNERMSIGDEEVQKMAAFDLLALNGDRNSGNCLYKDGKIFPIDHGLILMSDMEVEATWEVWPQIKSPINQRTKDWIVNYDIDEKCKRLRELGIDEDSIYSHRLMHLILKKGVIQNLSLYQISKLFIPDNGEEPYYKDLMEDAIKELMDEGEEFSDEDVFNRVATILSEEDLPEVDDGVDG